MLLDRPERVAGGLRMDLAQQEVEHCGAERIVHRRVQLAAEEIFAQRAVTHLVGSVLPDLAEKERIFFLFLHRRTDVADEAVRQLVGNVQPPAGSAAPQPAAHHAVLAAEKFPERGIVFLHVREIGHVPPAFVAVAVLIAEAEPGAVFFRRAVVAELVKVHAVRAGVVEYAVEHDADAALSCGFAERFKILFPAEQRIDAGVVRCVVPVVACRLKDRVQVQDRDAKRGKIRQLFLDAPERSAPERPRGNIPVFRAGIEHRRIPVAHEKAVRAAARLRLARRPVALTGKAVRKDLIDDAVLPPVGDGGFFIYGDLPGARLVVSGTE